MNSHNGNGHGHGHQSHMKASQKDDAVLNGTRYYTAWRGDFTFGEDNGGEGATYLQQRVLWSQHYNATRAEAEARQAREALKLAKVGDSFPGAINNVTPDGIVAVDMIDGKGTLRNRAFNTPIGLAFCLDGTVLDQPGGEGETTATDIFEDNPPQMSDILAMLLGAGPAALDAGSDPSLGEDLEGPQGN